jgi:hypothetical protein
MAAVSKPRVITEQRLLGRCAAMTARIAETAGCGSAAWASEAKRIFAVSEASRVLPH